MNNILKKVLLAPLMGSLVFGVSACTPKNDETLPHSVKDNIEQTMNKVFDITESEDFMLALSDISSNKEGVKNFDKEMKEINSLVADDQNVSNFVNEAKGFMTDGDEESIKILGKSTPFISTFYTYSPTGVKIDSVNVDPTAFEKKDNSWFPVKNGALGYMDNKGRYVAFSGTTDNISFTDTGDKLTLASVVDEIKYVQSQQTDTYVATEKALTQTMEWLEKNEPGWVNKPVDLAKNQNKILEGFKHPDGLQFKFIGDTSEFTLEVLNSNTKELVRFTSADGSINSSIQPETRPEAESTEAYVLYNEYVDEFLASVENGNEEYASLEETAKLLDDNEDNPKVKWSVYGADGDKTIVARSGGAEYKFSDITNIYSGISYGGENSSDAPMDGNSTTETGEEVELNLEDFVANE